MVLLHHMWLHPLGQCTATQWSHYLGTFLLTQAQREATLVTRGEVETDVVLCTTGGQKQVKQSLLLTNE